MKVDTHVLLLILIVGIISAGLVGANVLNTDQSMKQQVFDGIKISVPSDSNFVKIGDGVYKDSGYGITINTFKNNNSMISFLKNTNNSKVVPIKNQPPQSVAFKKGDTISIMVTNGQEGVSVSSKDGELTSKIANNIVFSNNHRSEKPSGLNIINPQMNVHDDFNLILLLVADVDTKIFNQAIIQDNLIIVANDFNEENANNTFFFSPNVEVTDMEDNADSNNILTADDANSNSTTLVDSSQSSGSNNTVASSSSGGSSQASSSNNSAASSSGASSSSQGSNDELVNSLFGEDASKNNAAGSDAASPSSSSSQSAPVSAQQSSSSSAPASSSPSSSFSSSSPSSSGSSSSSSSSGSSSSSSANTPQKLSYNDCKGLAEKVISHQSGLSIDGHDESGDSYIFHIKDSTNKNVGDIVVDATSGQVDSSGLRP